MREALTFRRATAADLLAVATNPLYPTQLGLAVCDTSWEQAEAYASWPSSHVALRGTEPVAAMGIAETFEDVAGLAWALWARGLSLHEIAAVTVFARDEVIGASRLARIEAVVRCRDPEVESADNQGWLVPHCLAEPTPQVRWALAVGLEPVAVLRKFGAASETHMLLERIR